MKLSFATATAIVALTGAGAAHAVTAFVTSAAPMIVGQGRFVASALYTISDTLPNGYQSVGIPDGIGAYKLDANTVRIMVNHELSSGGKSYTLDSGASMKGARVSYFDINIASRKIVDGGMAYTAIYDRSGNAVAPGNTIADFSRFCSSSAFEANSFGAGRGLVDRIYFTGEENGNGTMYALDTATKTMRAIPAFGYASFENAAQVDTGTTNKVAFLLADDTGGAPQTLYVGTKNPGGDYLDRNGLKNGKLYAWAPNDPSIKNGDNFNGGNGASVDGHWVELTVQDPSKAGTAGYDALGYARAATLQAEGRSKGAFAYSRLEDVATNPKDGSLIGFVTTGTTGTIPGNTDVWGKVYTLKIGFDAAGNPVSGHTTIVYNGNLDTANRALRSPDNIDWVSDTSLLAMEDRAADWPANVAANPNEAGILLVGLDGTVTAAARVDRSAIYPFGVVDSFPGAAGLGEWETSGILDVSMLFGYSERGHLFLGDVQAHGIKTAPFDFANLGEGGQIFFLQAVPEPASWGMMLAGFGLVGGAMRRRARTTVTVTA